MHLSVANGQKPKMGAYCDDYDDYDDDELTCQAGEEAKKKCGRPYCETGFAGMDRRLYVPAVQSKIATSR